MELPEDLKENAIFIGGELAWPISLGLRLIERFTELGLAILGLEIWRPQRNGPQVIGWSEYQKVFDGDWNLFVEKNAVEARRLLQRPFPADTFVNFTWITKADFINKNRSCPN